MAITRRRATWTARVERTGYENRTDNSCQKSSTDEKTKAFRNPAPTWEDSDKTIFQQNCKWMKDAFNWLRTGTTYDLPWHRWWIFRSQKGAKYFDQVVPMLTEECEHAFGIHLRLFAIFIGSKGQQILQKYRERPPSARCQKSEMKQVLYWATTNLGWHVNFAMIWLFLLGACVLTHFSMCNEKNRSNYAENITRHRTQFSHPGDQAPGICAPLINTTVIN
jgi:hypothetical protein